MVEDVSGSGAVGLAPVSAGLVPSAWRLVVGSRSSLIYCEASLVFTFSLDGGVNPVNPDAPSSVNGVFTDERVGPGRCTPSHHRTCLTFDLLTVWTVMNAEMPVAFLDVADSWPSWSSLPLVVVVGVGGPVTTSLAGVLVMQRLWRSQRSRSGCGVPSVVMRKRRSICTLDTPER